MNIILPVFRLPAATATPGARASAAPALVLMAVAAPAALSLLVPAEYTGHCSTLCTWCVYAAHLQTRSHVPLRAMSVPVAVPIPVAIPVAVTVPVPVSLSVLVAISVSGLLTVSFLMPIPLSVTGSRTTSVALTMS